MNHSATNASADDRQGKTAPTDGLTTPRRHWSITAIWLAMTMSVLDGMIANIVLPTIAQQLSVSPTATVWVVNIYQIAIVMLLLPFSAAGEIFGYRRVYLGGLALFGLASLGCSMAGGLALLIVWRFVQGIGAAAIMAVNGALIRLTFPAHRLGRAIGYNAIIVSIAAASGPTLAAAILSVASWRWIFAVNLPIGLAAFVIGLRALPSSDRAVRPFDWVSSLLNAAFFGSLFFLTTDLVAHRIGPSTLVKAGIAAVAGIVLVRTARTRNDPLIPIDLLRLPRLRISYLASISAFAGQMLGLVALPFYLQPRFGHVAVGLLITSFPLGILLGAPIAGRLSDRMSSRPLCMTGLAIFALGYALLWLTDAAHAAAIVACLGIAGFGFGFFQPSNNRVMLGEAPRPRSGAAAGMIAVCRMLGQTTGALMAALVLSLLGTGSSLAFIGAAGLGLAGTLASASRVASENGTPGIPR